MIVNLPPALTLGDRVGVRFAPDSGEDEIYVTPDGSDTINGASSFAITSKGACYTFVVGEVGDWWIESDYTSGVD